MAESCDGPPLAPISNYSTVGLPEEHQTSEAGVFAQDLFPYAHHHYKEVLLANAHLYTFALYYQIKGLQDLSLQRLTQVLMWINCRQPHAAYERAALIQRADSLKTATFVLLLFRPQSRDQSCRVTCSNGKHVRS
jgi:hypothetical protein